MVAGGEALGGPQRGVGVEDVIRLGAGQRGVEGSEDRLEQTDASYRETLRAHNEYNRRIFDLIHEEALLGHGVVISLTDCWRMSDYGEPIVALKSYIMSPFSEPEYVDAVLESLWQAREQIASSAIVHGPRHPLFG